MPLNAAAGPRCPVAGDGAGVPNQPTNKLPVAERDRVQQNTCCCTMPIVILAMRLLFIAAVSASKYYCTLVALDAGAHVGDRFERSFHHPLKGVALHRTVRIEDLER